MIIIETMTDKSLSPRGQQAKRLTKTPLIGFGETIAFNFSLSRQMPF